MSDQTWTKPTLNRTVFEFVQDGNTLGTTDEIEHIEIITERQLPGDPPFVVIKTAGWSLENGSELGDLIDSCVYCLARFVLNEVAE